MPEGSLYGYFDQLQMHGTYVAYKASIPEAGFGDTYIFTLIIYDQATNQKLQIVRTRLMVGGDGFGHRLPYHLDGAVFQNGTLYLKGGFPKVPKIWVRLGDPRNNSTGLLEGAVASPNLIVVPFTLPMGTMYAFPYDVVLHVSELNESFTLPAGLKLEP